MKPDTNMSQNTNTGQTKTNWCTISFPSVLQSDTRYHYPVSNDGMDTHTVAVVEMRDPVSAAESCQNCVYDRCKILHIYTQTAGLEMFITTAAPEGFKQL